MIERMKTEDYKIFKLPKSVQSVYTTFPFSSVFSVSIATMRVPSRLADFIQVNLLFFNFHYYIESFSYILFRQIN